MIRRLDPYQRALRQHRAESWIDRNTERRMRRDWFVDLAVIAAIGALMWLCVSRFVDLAAR